MGTLQQIKSCFSSKANVYERHVDIQPIVAQKIANTIPKIMAQHILELGSGSGLLSQYLFNQFPEARLNLVDFSEDMIEVCKRRFKNVNNVMLTCCNIEEFSTVESFDIIASSMVLHWVSNLTKCLQYLTTKINPGGLFVFSMLGENSLKEWRDVCHEFSDSIPTPSFPSFSQIKNDFPNFHLEVSYINKKYKSAYDFLKTLKNIGANATREEHVIFSTGTLRRIMHAFDQRDVCITYEIIYGRYQQL